MTKAKAPASPPEFWRDAYDLAKDIHAVEVRILQGQITALEAQLARSPSLAEVNARMAAAMREEPEEEGDKKGGENPLRKSNPVQWIMDSLEESIPLGNDQARNNVRTWAERQLRLRGPGSIDTILEEALQGDISDEPVEEVEP